MLFTEYWATLADYVWIPAQEFTTVNGAPTLSNIYRRPVWLLDAAGSEIIGTTVEIPEQWTTYHVDLWWMNAGAGSGAIDLYLEMKSDGDGDTLTANPVTVTGTPYTAGAQNVVTVSRLTTYRTSVGGEVEALNIFRFGGGGGDTLANDCAILGVRLVNATP